jgi:hypothetical protein
LVVAVVALSCGTILRIEKTPFAGNAKLERPNNSTSFHPLSRNTKEKPTLVCSNGGRPAKRPKLLKCIPERTGIGLPGTYVSHEHFCRTGAKIDPDIY